jgi:Tat protein secretion system quality control protein TatD with DNase activity
MVYKTLVREIIRPLKEALPKLQKMYEFMSYEENVENTKDDTSADSLKNVSEKEVEEVEVVEVNIDLTKPTPEVTKKAEELIEIYGVNPTQEEEDLKKLSSEIDSIIKLSSETAEEKTMIKEFRQKMINRFASQIIALRENPDNKKVINEMFGLIANKVK